MSDPPDGIGREMARVERGRANPLPLILVTLFMIAGLMGFMGGQPSPVKRVENENVIIEIHGPNILRNGMTFETHITVQAKQPIRNLSFSIADTLWRDMTINTMIPAASDEDYRNGSYHFAFSELAAGEEFQFKIDGQINPPLVGSVQGPITLWDGPKKLAVVDFRRRILP